MKNKQEYRLVVYKILDNNKKQIKNILYSNNIDFIEDIKKLWLDLYNYYNYYIEFKDLKNNNIINYGDIYEQ